MMKPSVFQKVSAIIIAGAMSFGTVTPAFALTHADDAMIPGNTVTTTGDYTRGAATRAAMPSIEILGLASVEESGQFVNTSDYYNWAQPKYMLTATYYNETISPLLANLGTGKGTPTYPAAVLDPARSGGGAGPNAALGSSEDDDAVWALNPRLVVGTGGDGASSYASHGAVGVAYGFNDYTGLAETMSSIASAADALSNVQLRYEDTTATQIANDYREYIFGTLGAVGHAIESGDETVRNIVLVNGATWNPETEDYDYTLLVSAEQDGTASTNRYLETTSNTGIERLDSLMSNHGIAYNYAKTCGTSISYEDLQDLIDKGQINLILVGGQQRAGDYGTIMDALLYDQLLDMTYFVKDNGSAGAQYGVVMNSVENAQNVGRILGMLYPNTINQQDWLAYYYEEFYHIKGSLLATVMANALDGVRNAAITSIEYADANDNALSLNEVVAAATEWDANGGYSSSSAKQNVIDTLEDGFEWLFPSEEVE